MPLPENRNYDVCDYNAPLSLLHWCMQTAMLKDFFYGQVYAQFGAELGGHLSYSLSADMAQHAHASGPPRHAQIVILTSEYLALELGVVVLLLRLSS